MKHIPEDVSTVYVALTTVFLLSHSLSAHLLMAKAWQTDIEFVRSPNVHSLFKRLQAKNCDPL